jgi:hypothetical protein
MFRLPNRRQHAPERSEAERRRRRHETDFQDTVLVVEGHQAGMERDAFMGTIGTLSRSRACGVVVSAP